MHGRSFAWLIQRWSCRHACNPRFPKCVDYCNGVRWTCSCDLADVSPLIPKASSALNLYRHIDFCTRVTRRWTTHISAGAFSCVPEDEITTYWTWCWKQILDNNRCMSTQTSFCPSLFFSQFTHFLARGADVQHQLFSYPILSHISASLSLAVSVQSLWLLALWKPHGLKEGDLLWQLQLLNVTNCRDAVKMVSLHQIKRFICAGNAERRSCLQNFPSLCLCRISFFYAPYRKLFCNHKPALSVSHDPRQDYTAVPGTGFPLCEPFKGF